MESDPNETVTVRVTYTERVRYTHTVKMTRAEFAKYDAVVDGDPESVIDAVIHDRSANIQDADFLDLYEFDIAQ